MHTALLEAIENRQAQVGVVGLGYVGLPLVKALLDAGFRTLGFDIDEDKVAQLRLGNSYIRQISGDWLAERQQAGDFEPTSDLARLDEPDVVIICVPTPLTEARAPDLSYVLQTASQIAAAMRRGQLIVLESTTYPGTTRDLVLPMLERSGLRLGEEFFLAYSPEREDPGNPDHSAAGIPKVVGGMNSASLQLADALYSQVVVRTVPVSSCEVAEASKILENTYRAVNIALVNELKMLLDKLQVDIWEVIEAARSKPFGFQAFYPGPGLGGHCIPIDPFYLSWLARKHDMATRFIELAGEVNSSMPGYVVERITWALNQNRQAVNGSRIGLLGVAYKKDVDDPRESPAFRLFELLDERGAELSYHDPYVTRLPAMRRFEVPSLVSQELTEEWLAAQDCVVIVTDHSAIDYEFVVRHASLIVDTRNATRDLDQGPGKIVRA